MLKAVIFDFDGVIADSVGIKTQAFESLFMGEDTRLREEMITYHLRHGGMSRVLKFRYFYKHILRRPLPDEDLTKLEKEFSRLVKEQVIACPLFAGCREFLERYHGSLRLHIVSGTPEGELREIVERKGLVTFFRSVKGSPPRKPQALGELLRAENYVPEETVFVGDSPDDGEAAAACRVPFILFAGFDSLEKTVKTRLRE